MRFLLLNPPYLSPKKAGYGISFPVGLAYLGAALRRAGIDVVALDAAAEAPPVEVDRRTLRFGLSNEELSARIADLEPDIVGISCFFSSRFPAALEAARITKGVRSRIVTIIGGIHASLVPENACQHPEIDFAAVGEGEGLIVDFAEAMSGGTSLENIPGLAYKKDGRVVVNPRNGYVENLDILGFPAYDLFDMEIYLSLNEGRWDLGYGRYAPVVTSRGCPYRCTFCSIHCVMGPKYRVHSPRYVVDNIEELVKTYGVDEISFEDDNLTYDEPRFVDICRGIVDRGIRIRWNTPNGVHVGSLTAESLVWAKRSGCDSLNMAVESGDDFIRNRVIKKGLSSEKIYEISSACRRTGIKANAYFVIGMPGETENSIAASRKFIRDLKFSNLSIFIATPMPGTKLYDECVTRGYLDEQSFDAEFADYQAALFMQPSIQTPEFDKEKVRIWQHSLYIEYFKAALRDRFWYWLRVNPRAWMAMAAKVLLHEFLGPKLSYRLVERIRRIMER
jgi:anaerobic magnesium-protoporphyrin IX monomethyl ester cyclase